MQEFAETKGTRLGHERSRNGNRVAADSRAKLSVIPLSISVILFLSNTYILNRRHTPQPDLRSGGLYEEAGGGGGLLYST